MKPIILIIFGVVGMMVTLGFAVHGETEIYEYEYKESVNGSYFGSDENVLVLEEDDGGLWLYPAENKTELEPGDKVQVMIEYSMTCPEGKLLGIEKV